VTTDLGTTSTPRIRSNPDFDRSKKMSLIQEDLARAHMSARLHQARGARLGHQLAAARRLSRKAERAAAQARLALARVL
jgi:hypothetical protein